MGYIQLNDLIKLGKEIEITNNYETISEFNYRQVFANKLSIKSKEHYDAAQIGLKPELAFEVWQEEYENEVIVEYKGVKYYVFRTFENKKNARIELYLTKNLGEVNE